MNFNKKQVVIIHGAFGTPEENWFPWLASRVMEAGHQAIRPRLPTPGGQNLNNWRREFESQVGPLSPNSILVGHSLAVAFILDILGRIERPIVGTFLVSGFLGKLGIEDFDSINESFVCRDFDWDQLRLNAGAVWLYNSDNDPYVPIARGEALARNLNVDLHVIHQGGHINTSAGFTKFDQLWRDLASIL